jgi:SAM-dependent methyltransferase
VKLADLGAQTPIVPWTVGGKIPWNKPAFSRRMLREHLLQEHDRASRRFETIDKHVSWIHEHELGAIAGRVLDLCCGPGFYTARLAGLGHTCVGIDFSPASISYARSESEREALPCEYRLEDLSVADLGSGFELVLLSFGELNTFPPSHAEAILVKARRALARHRATGLLVAS